jgi:threonine/homoserine/homoserine lactone efflux protein
LFEELGVLYRGIVLGLMIAAPVGPVGLLCIRRTVQKGLLIGFATGFGAAFADALFSAVAAFSVAAILDLVQNYKLSIHVLGGAFLLIVAWHTWHDTPRQPQEDAPERRLLGRLGSRLGNTAKALVGSFIITLTNPVTLFAVLAVVATFGGLRSHGEAIIIVSGVFTGSALWWLILSCGVALVRHRLTENTVKWINRATGVALAVIAVWAITSGIAGYFGGLPLHNG